MNSGRQQHWDDTYHSNAPGHPSWYQSCPDTSLTLIAEGELPKDATLIDIGGGDSLLADYLLDLGYTDITVLDISAEAIGRARNRLGKNAERIHWIISDITEFVPQRRYDCWHDRATFHFLTGEEEIRQYLSVAQRAIAPGGIMVIGTFSENGPGKCSGLPVRQYTESALTDMFRQSFDRIRCIRIEHITPAQTVQPFVFCQFTKKNQLHGLS